MLRRVLATIARALDLARLFNLPDWHPDRRIGDGLNIEGDDDAVEQHSYQRTFCREGRVLPPLRRRRVRERAVHLVEQEASDRRDIGIRFEEDV
jgi:hypothetical protein